MGMLAAALALAASLVLPAATAATRQTAAAAPRPQTLFALPSGTIQGFAQDRSLVAWFSPDRKRCNAVNVLSLTQGTRVVLPDESGSAPNVTCRWDLVPQSPVPLALAGTDALWVLREAGAVPFDYILGAGYPNDTRERRVKEVAHSSKGPGLWLGGIAGDHDSLVYATTTVSYVDELACLSNGSCDMKISGGGIFRVVGSKPPVQIDAAPPAVEVAVSGTNVAYVQAATIGKNGTPGASADLPIEVRNTITGALVCRAKPGGVPLAVALSPLYVSAIERTPLGLRLAWYDATSGDPRGSVSLPAGTSPELAASDQLLAFRVGRSISGVRLPAHRVTPLARAAGTPIGMSLEGGRLAWAENVGGKGRIRALYLKGAPKR